MQRSLVTLIYYRQGYIINCKMDASLCPYLHLLQPLIGSVLSLWVWSLPCSLRQFKYVAYLSTVIHLRATMGPTLLLLVALSSFVSFLICLALNLCPSTPSMRSYFHLFNLVFVCSVNPTINLYSWFLHIAIRPAFRAMELCLWVWR